MTWVWVCLAILWGWYGRDLVDRWLADEYMRWDVDAHDWRPRRCP